MFFDPQRQKYLFLLCLGITLAAAATQQTVPPPSWAYAIAAPDYKAPVEDGVVRHVPGSSSGWTLTQLRDLFFAPDWHPEEHAVLPDVVAHGRKPEVFACGFCHRAEGTGGPENASLAGLPKEYLIQQMAEFKSGARKSSFPDHGPAKLMAALAKSASDDEVAQAAAYFSGVKPRKLISVIETNEVPKTYVAGWVYTPTLEKEKEPIAGRIIEMPTDLEQFESRDTHSEFVAWVPKGSVAAGKKLATTGAHGNTVACSTCHGADLQGMQAVPGIAGRSPSYLMRQLYDMKYGARTGPATLPMKPVLAHLSEEDMTALAAYAASLNP
ncbi:MAG TPA: c-type cytochrome [Terriglobales bacterium]|jgi:cytochrome c553|nr:c-type cytochrome [Terriglobales bacterium]